MVGAPPPAAHQVTLENWLAPQYNTWAFQHVETIMPTTTVDRGAGAVTALDAQPYDLGKFEFTDPTGKKRTSRNSSTTSTSTRWCCSRTARCATRSIATANRAHAPHHDVGDEVVHRPGRRNADRRRQARRNEAGHRLRTRAEGQRMATVRRCANVLNMEIGIDYTEIYDDPSSIDLPVQLRRRLPAGARRRHEHSRRCTSSCRRCARKASTAKTSTTSPRIPRCSVG